MAQRNLVVRFLGQDRDLTKAFKRARVAMRGLGKLSRSVGTGLKRIGVGLAVGLAGVVASAIKATNSIDGIAKAAQRMTTDLSTIQELDLAARLGGSNLPAFIKLIEKVGSVVGKQFVSPVKEVTDALKFLKVPLKDLETLTPDKVFEKLSRSLLDLKDKKLQGSIGRTLFGRGFQEALPAIKGYTENIDRARAAVTGLGLGLDTKLSNQVVQMKDDFTVLADIIGNQFLKVFEQLAPTLRTVVNLLGRATTEFLAAQGGGEKFAASLGTIILNQVNAATDKLKALTDAVKSVTSGFSTANKILGIGPNLASTAAIATARAGVRAVQGDFSGSVDAIKDGVKEGMAETQEAAKETVRVLKRMLQQGPGRAVAQ